MQTMAGTSRICTASSEPACYANVRPKRPHPPPPLLLLTPMFVTIAGPQRGSQCHLCCHTAARGPCPVWARPLGPSQNRCHATKAPHSSQPACACAAKSATGQRQAEPVFVQAGEAAGLRRCGSGRPCSATGCTDEVRSTRMRMASFYS